MDNLGPFSTPRFHRYYQVMSDLESAAPVLRNIAIEAGRRILDVYEQDFEVMKKADASPLTEADLASHKVIIDGIASLPAALSSIPEMSEEGTLPEWEEYREWAAWWLIDPLDGTKEFVKRNGEFTVNIALIRRPAPGEPGVPVAGWVYAPVPDVLYEGIAGMGAVRIESAGSSRPDSPVPLPAAPPLAPPRIIASRSHRSTETDKVIDAVTAEFGIGGIVSSGSSLKLCMVAEGAAELYPRCAPTMEWDTAAADAVCRAAGARVVRAADGRNLEYGKENLLNPWFLVSADEKLIRTSLISLQESSSR